jgi:2-polyprenyl-6-methoxyphenol hydroxylase-like FAD-dependent oxidoreductase
VDTERLPVPSTRGPMSQAAGSAAIVVGGSLAGLLAAKVLADHVGSVTVIERDRLPVTVQGRKGVPHGRQLHALMEGGQRAVEQLLPGFTDALLATGAVPMRVPEDLAWLTPAGWARPFPAAGTMISASRPLIEWHVRCRVLADPRITLRQAAEVTGLLVNAGAVTGVRILNRDTGAVAELAADLVVDASGRGSTAPQWLTELGYPAPAEEEIASGIGYATRIFARPVARPGRPIGTYLQAAPPHHNRMGIMFPIEGDRLIVSVGGAGGDHAPTDDAGWREFAASLRSPLISAWLADAEPLSPVFAYRRTSNVRRRYERLHRRPAGFLVLGDAACAFNPIYGQGMSVAALSALALREELAAGRGRRRDLAARVQRRAAKVAAGAWLLATAEDLRFPTTTGARANVVTRLQHRYLDRVVARATEHQPTNAAFTQVLTMTSPPTRLFAPGVVAAALRGRRRPPLADPPLGLPMVNPVAVPERGAGAA